jgi:hypothetical protein
VSIEDRWICFRDLLNFLFAGIAHLTALKLSEGESDGGS